MATTVKQLPGRVAALADKWKRKNASASAPYVYTSVNLFLSGSGEWRALVSGPGTSESRQFPASTADGALEAAEAWINTDTLALCNQTLGLSADGRFADTAA